MLADEAKANRSYYEVLLIYNVNSSGARTEPCGSLGFDSSLSTFRSIILLISAIIIDNLPVIDRVPPAAFTDRQQVQLSVPQTVPDGS